MRHRKSGRKLKRTASHKKALLIALTTALLKNKKIKTTLAKAKEARPFAEKLITRAKNAVVNEENVPQKDVHARREVYRYIKDRGVITELFTEIVPKISTRAGGYTR
ncbi:MAG: 50S ribosomal protein L17, partial [Bacteroidota bacterium]